uniref:PRONE domain-containing protein n=1 Tax=Brassica oleracea TaxID=3712 RepID=A0A3P6FD57_BRAOL|nr:unnamed protein product [Brassica oleracea]
MNVKRVVIIYTKLQWLSTAASLVSYMANLPKVYVTSSNYVMAERAEILLYCLKHCLGLSQLYMQDSDVMRELLKCRSRVLQGLAFNIVAWNDSVIFVDKIMRRSE